MAADNKDDLRKKIEEQISKLSKKSAESYREQLRALNAVNASLDAYQNTLEDISDRIADQSQGFAGILEEIQGINEELVKEGKFTRDATKALSGLESIASKLKSDQKGYNDLNQKQLQQEKSKLKILQDQFEESAKRIKQRGAQNAQEQAIIDAYEEQKSIFQRTNGLLDDRIEQEKIYTKNLGATGALLTGMSKIPLVGPLLDVNDALELAREKAKAGGNAFQVMATGLSSVGKSLVTNMLDPLTLVTGLIDTFVKLDKAAGDFAKSQNMTYSDALKARESYASMAASSGDLALNASNLMETQTAIGEQLGTNGKLSESDLKTFTKLREQAGMTNEELLGMQKYSMATGGSLKENVESFQASAKIMSFQKGVALNTKKLMADMSNVSNRTKLSIQGGATGLAKAAVAAKLMGGDLSKVADVADQLLDFEQSIESELSAELLLGKDINLEKARQAALNNDLATVAEEITKQAGSAAEFSKMNRIQQDAMAKAVGMTADQLADTLVEQEALKSIGKSLNEEEQKAFEAAKKKYGIEEASKMLQDGQLENLVDQQSNAEKFAQTIEHVKEIFVSIVDGPLGAILNGLSEMLKSTKVIYTITGLLAGVYAGKMVGGIVQTIAKIAAMTAANTANAAAATAGATAMSFGAIIPIILAGVGAVAGLIASFTADDLMSAPPGYGKRTLVGPEGAIQLNDKDTVIAGTNLFGNDVKSEPGKPTQFSGKGEYKLNGDSSAVVNAIAELRRDVNALANRPINVAIDGKKVIEATTGNQPNTVGDESRKNSYQIS
jgi:hypothetical protein